MVLPPPRLGHLTPAGSQEKFRQGARNL